MSQQDKPVRMLPAREVRDRFGVSAMTIHRWEKRGILPRPTKINGRNYWPEPAIAAIATGAAA